MYIQDTHVNRVLLVFLFFFLRFIYFYWLCWVFIVACRLSLIVVSGGDSSLRGTGFSRCVDSRHTGFCSCSSRALEHGPSSYDARA